MRKYAFLLAIPLLCSAQTLKLTKKAQTFDRAQSIAWVSAQSLVVARWDATLSIFRPPGPGEFGPMLTEVLMAPSKKPVEAVIPISADSFVTSNDEKSLSVWRSNGNLFSLAQTLQYDASIGTVNSGSLVEDSGKSWLVAGHSEGYLTIWTIKQNVLRFERSVSVRSLNPIPSPYKLWNVRGVVAWKGRLVVTGGEDGDLALVEVPTGTIISRMRYNPAAQRGINSLSLLDDYLIAANCSVGSTDKNLWLYKVQADKVVPLDSVNLVKDTSRAQVFDFSTQLTRIDGQPEFFASTEEGLVWLGTIENDKLKTASSIQVVDSGGAALAKEPNSNLLSAVAYDVDLLEPSKQ